MDSGQCIADRFEIQALLGQGGMGDVYRALDTQTGEIVAVKALNPHVLKRDPALLERFIREGEALRQLDHPNIIRMIAAVEENGGHYLVMEYVGGGSLQDLISASGQLPHERVMQIALDLADALTRAHRLGIIHRDLKPANVLLAEDGTPRLADFGIAHLQGNARLTQTGVLVGTVDYLSPEVCQGEPPDELSDIWALGVLLFEMLTGRLPFEGRNLTAKITAILNQRVPDLVPLVPAIPDILADLVNRMLEKDRQQRIPSIRQVGAELESILKGRGRIVPSRTESTGRRFATPAPSKDAPRHNLPVQTTAFVGRQAELVELDRSLADPGVRLLSILGVGGMGKTRLALEAGARQLEHYPHGVYFIALAGIQAVEEIVTATAQALGFSFYEGPEPRQQLLDFLREKSMLLIFDNFEHLVSGASLVNDLLHSASSVKLLITSRLPLSVPVEHIFHLSGLDFPDWETPSDALEYGAVKLFLQGARRVCPGFELALDDLKYVARICRLVGGMPLGILLASAWLEMLTPAEVADEIQKSLDFLATDLSGMDLRQRSIRAILDYSWSSLTEHEQSIFQRLAVFRGGCTREAVQTVTQASLRDLIGLVNKSLLTRAPSGRYEIHEFLRQYAAEKLSTSSEIERTVRDDHCAYFAEFLHQREADLHGEVQQIILAEIETDNENIRAGWKWAVDNLHVQRISQYLEGLSELCLTRGWLHEGARLMLMAEQGLAATEQDDLSIRLLHGRLFMWQGRFSNAVDTSENTNQLLQTSIAILRELGAYRELAYALCYQGGCESLYGDSHGESFCQEALARFQELDDERGIALALMGWGWVALHQGDYPAAKERFQNSLERFRALGDHRELARSLGGLGYTYWILGQYQLSKQHHEEMLALCRDIYDQGGIARSLADLGIDMYGLRDYRKAREFWLASLALYKEIGDPWGMADELGDLGAGSLATGEYEQAAHLAQQSLDLYAKVSRNLHDWELMVMGEAMLGMENLSAAEYYLRQSLKASLRTRMWGRALNTLPGVGLLLAKRGQDEYAFELLALVMHHHASWQMAKDKAAPLLAELDGRLPVDVAAAAQARGQARDLEGTIKGLLAGLGRDEVEGISPIDGSQG